MIGVFVSRDGAEQGESFGAGDGCAAKGQVDHTNAEVVRHLPKAAQQTRKVDRPAGKVERTALKLCNNE